MHPQYGNAKDAQFDVDVVEAKLDDSVRHLISAVYGGATSLQEQVRRPPWHAILCMQLSHASGSVTVKVRRLVPVSGGEALAAGAGAESAMACTGVHAARFLSEWQAS